MKTRIFAVIATMLLLAGCASSPKYSNVGNSGSVQRVQSSEISGKNTGLILGGTAGAAAASAFGADKAVAVFMTAAAAAAGAFVGSEYDAQQAAIGRTDCGYSASKTGTDQNGNYQQTAKSHKVVKGYKADCN